MPKLSGIFEQYKDLDNIPIEDISHWLRSKSQLFYIENFIANRILYPSTISTTPQDLEMDLAVVREIAKRSLSQFYNATMKKMYIPQEFMLRFPPVWRLVQAIMDVIEVDGIVQIYSKSEGNSQIIGSIVSPLILPHGNPIKTVVNGEITNLYIGTVTPIPAHEAKNKFKLGTTDEIVIAGGHAGIIVDLRRGIQNK